MPTYIAMLRGVNVGGNVLKMEWLREACAKLGLRDVKTYIQSGNIVFKSEMAESRLVSRLQKTINAQTRLPVPVIIHTASELRKVLAGNPFLKAKGVDPAKLHVTFLGNVPSKPDLERLNRLAGTRDECRLSGREIYLHCPLNYGETKLSNTAIEKALSVQATTRNWKTVNKLYAMSSM